MVVGPSLELVLMLRDNPHRVKLVLSTQCWVGQNVLWRFSIRCYGKPK